jgi:hypothetical protein
MKNERTTHKGEMRGIPRIGLKIRSVTEQFPMKSGAAFGATLYCNSVHFDATRCDVDNQTI